MGKGAKNSSSNVSEATPVLTNGHKSSSEEISTQDLAQLSGLEEWKAFEQATKNMMKHREAYKKWDDVLEEFAIQKEKAESFAAKIEDLKKHQAMMVADFAEKYKEWMDEKEELTLQAKTEDEKKGSAHSEEVTALNKEIASLKEELETAHKDKQALQKKHDDTRRHCIETKDEVEMWRKKTERYEQNFATLDDTALETHEEEAKKLQYRSFHLLSFFKGDLSPSTFIDYSEWERNETALNLKFRLPASNSPAAEAVRIAASLHTFGASLNSISGRSWYSLTSADDSEKAAGALRAIFKEDVAKNSLARSLFLSMHQKNEAEAVIRSAAESASKNVFEKLKFLITGNADKYRSELDKLFQDWAVFWLNMQYSKEQVEATLNDEEDSDLTEGWIIMEELGEEISIEGIDSQSVPLFPCIYSCMSGKTIQPGHSLVMDQEQVIAAKEEAQAIARARKSVPRIHSRRRSAVITPGNMSNIGKVLAQSA